MKALREQRGFTLVELAIVLVIIGIILGAVLKGQALIDNAKAKRVQDDMKGLEAMIWTYFDRSNRLPGDCDMDGVIEYNTPNNTTGTTPSNNTDPTTDDCSAGAEGNVNRAFSDLRVAQIAPYGQPNINFATHKASGLVNIGMDTVAGTNYSAIFLYGLPTWMAKMIDVSVDGVEDGAAGRVRRHDTADGGAAWPAASSNGTPVTVTYYFDRAP
ncbi:MAG: prepilin-type N-terminal cleavage/methylation domain-containing protein [Thermodesulfovibrionales bacterium]